MGSHNISSDATAPGTNALTGVSAATLFMEPGSNLSLKPGANPAVVSGNGNGVVAGTYNNGGAACTTAVEACGWWHHLRQAGNRQTWLIRLDGMPANLREKLEAK